MAPKYHPPDELELRPMRARDIRARYERLRDWLALQERGAEGLARGFQMVWLFRHGDRTVTWAFRVDRFLGEVWPEEFE